TDDRVVALREERRRDNEESRRGAECDEDIRRREVRALDKQPAQAFVAEMVAVGQQHLAEVCIDPVVGKSHVGERAFCQVALARGVGQLLRHSDLYPDAAVAQPLARCHLCCPAPAAAASRTTRAAIAASWTPTPVRSAIVISSARVRPCAARSRSWPTVT